MVVRDLLGKLIVPADTTGVAVLFDEVLGVALAAGGLFCALFCAEVSAEAPARVEIPLEPNCGGVIESTAPRPPTVPPTINNARFMPLTSYPSTKEIFTRIYSLLNLRSP